MKRIKLALILLAITLMPSISSGSSWEKIFDGKSFKGWTLVGGSLAGYEIKDGVITVKEEGGGNLFTEGEYTDFAFKFDFNLDRTGNNGIGIRAPLQGDAAYMGMECQVLDDSSPDYANLLPAQYHGSLYKIVAAKRGAQKPIGQWNHEEITAIGRHIKVVLNGKVIVNADLNTVNEAGIFAEHPGMLRDRGHIGFLGHGPSKVRFRNVYLKDLSKTVVENAAPTGFTTLFNGKDLTGWKALVGNPASRAKMTDAELRAAISTANVEAFKHWTVREGAIHYDGKNDSLCTVKDYGDFEMLVDWKIKVAGDSGIYLRGSPQVQIWDREVGSGGLYNNQKNPSNPTSKGDLPVGEWNRFRILMVGDRVTVYLNNILVVQNVLMENYWERDKPIYPVGQLELQHHGDELWFKNIFVREIARK